MVVLLIYFLRHFIRLCRSLECNRRFFYFLDIKDQLRWSLTHFILGRSWWRIGFCECAINLLGSIPIFIIQLTTCQWDFCFTKKVNFWIVLLILFKNRSRVWHFAHESWRCLLRRWSLVKCIGLVSLRIVIPVLW